MTNNYILARLKKTFKLSNQKIIELFASADYAIKEEKVINFLRKNQDKKFENCSDIQLASFLNGFINENRGKKEGVQPAPEKKLNNNIIFRKIKIALNLKAEDVLEFLSSVNFELGKSELSSFFRKEGTRQYRECQDQVLRNFLNGMEIKYLGRE